MRKKVVLQVPKYLKKYLLHPEFGQVIDGALYVGRSTFIGSYIANLTKPIPYILEKPDLNGTQLTIYYSTRERTHEIPTEKLTPLARALDEQFRRSLICEVRALHDLCGGDYSRFIRQFLTRYDIIADVDIDFETIRKVYRDYLERIDKANQLPTGRVKRSAELLMVA